MLVLLLSTSAMRKSKKTHCGPEH